MASTPRDRFDDLPDDVTRVGAHRAPPRRGLGWIRFAWAALATGVLVVAGLYGLSLVNPAISFDLPELGGGEAGPEVTTTPRPEVTPITDPALVDPELAATLTITVLNASPTDGAQNTAGQQIFEAGWVNPTRQNASVRDTETTVIYYWTSDYEPIALGLAELLGIPAEQIRLSDAYLGAPVTIVLGADYAPSDG